MRLCYYFHPKTSQSFCCEIFIHHLNKEALKSKLVLKDSHQFLVQEDGENPHTDPSSIKNITFK